MLVEDGYYDFQLLALKGHPNAISCENTFDNPAQFRLTRPNSPFQIVTVVDEHNYVNISTAQQWTLYAIVNGITTNSITTDNPDSTITLGSGDQNRYSITQG